MTDRLKLADVVEPVQDLILGRSAGKVGQAYGGDAARLRWLKGQSIRHSRWNYLTVDGIGATDGG